MMPRTSRRVKKITERVLGKQQNEQNASNKKRRDKKFSNRKR